jgi:competence protein ComEA
MDGLPSDWRVVEPPASTPLNPPGSKPPAADSSRLWYGVLGLGIAGLALAGAWMLLGSGDGAVAVDAAAIEVVASAGASSAVAAAVASAPPVTLLVVDVGGAVRRPGVYRLEDGARVGDAIAAAGGFAPSVDAVGAARDLNLAARLSDGDRVRVPARGEASTRAADQGAGGGGGGGAPAPDPGDGLVDLNTATASELEALPAIGPATAAKIIAAREESPFASVDDLRTRKLLGEASMAKVRDLVTVR